MKNKACIPLIPTILVVMLASEMIPIISADLEESKGARFTGVEYQTKIYASRPTAWRFTIYNENRTTIEGNQGWFFLVFYLDDDLLWSEYNDTEYQVWQCTTGRSVTLSYEPGEWEANTPLSHYAKIDLYWYNNGTYHLEDTTSFSFDVVLLTTLRHLHPFSYLVIYLLASFALLYYYYTTGVEPEL